MPLLLLAWSALALGAELLLPSATPRTPGAQNAALIFHGRVVQAASVANVTFEDPARIRAWVGATAGEGCYQRPERCPADLWPHTQARLAIVLAVGENPDGSLDVEARFFGPASAVPIHTLRETVAPTDTRFPATIVATAVDILPLIPTRGATSATSATAAPPIVPADPGITTEDPPSPTSSADPTAAIAPPPPPSTPPSAPVSRRRALYSRIPDPAFDRRLPASAREDWRRTGATDAPTWLEASHVRVAHGWVGIGAGYAMGDVDRGYGVSALYDTAAELEVGQAWSEGPERGAGPVFGAAVGYMPLWFVDTSLRVALGVSKSHGWRCASETGTGVAGDELRCLDKNETLSDTPIRELQPALWGEIEPRARWMASADWLAKPYALTGIAVQLHAAPTIPAKRIDRIDKYGVVTGEERIDYHQFGSGLMAGATVGAGVVVDALPTLSFSLELPYTWWFLSDTHYGSSGYDSVTEPVALPPHYPESGSSTATGSGRVGTLRVLLGVEMHL